MRNNGCRIGALALALLLVVAMSGIALAAKTVTIVGTVTDTNQIQTENDELIEVAESEIGDKLIEQTGKKVEVKGVVIEADGQKTIKVQSFKVMEE